MDTREIGQMRRCAGRLALGFFWMLVLSIAAQLGLQLLLRRFWPEALAQEWVTWLLLAVQYLVGIPSVLLCAGRLPTRAPARQPLSAGKLAEYFLAGYALMYLGNLAGNLLSGIFSRILSQSVSNQVAELVTSSSFWMNLLLVSVLAPVVEEFLFRKVILDRLLPFGEKPAVVVSALMFGLFHGNLYQVFYAFLVGMVLGLAYVRSGRLGCSILLHILFNFLGSVLASRVLAAGSVVLLNFYVIFLLSLAAAGLAFLLADRQSFRFRRTGEEQPPAAWRQALVRSPGVWLFVLGCGSLFVWNLL